MLGSALIVFRESLEAALIVAIVMGATRGVTGRGRWIAGGMAAGVAGAAVLAAFAGTIADAVAGRGQEILNACVLFAAVTMLAWHNVWMAGHGRELTAQMRKAGHDVKVGARPLSALALVTMFAVLREGSETVLFLYSLAVSGSGWSALIGGAALGLAGGAILGFALYSGLAAIPVGRFFQVVSWLVLLLASGLAASGADYLTQAGLLPVLVDQVWDTSAVLSQSSWLGAMLHILIGYTDRPTGIQLAFYGGTLVLIYGAMRLFGGTQQSRPANPAPSKA